LFEKPIKEVFKKVILKILSKPEISAYGIETLPFDSISLFESDPGLR